MILLFVVAVFLTTVFLGFPLVWAILISAVLPIMVFDLGYPLQALYLNFIGGVEPNHFIAIPLFIVAGELMSRGGVGQRIITFSKELFGFMPGGLGMVVVGASMIFGGISGSCSRATRAQVATYRSLAASFEIAAADVIDGKVTATSIADWVMDQTGAPLVYSSADPDVVRAAQTQFGTTRAAHAIEALFADLAAILAQRGVTRIVVAGGETSGAVVSGLGAQTLEIGPRLAAGVPVVRVAGAAPLCLALKSGNFGGANFFAEALARMKTPT